MNLVVAVSNPALWSAQAEAIEDMLSFLTGDVWSLAFVAGGFQPGPPEARAPRPETCVCLLSGGLDSLVGAIDLAASGEAPFFVSSLVRGDAKRQVDFADAIGGGHMQVNVNARCRHKIPEISQRPRSLAFIALGLLAATSLERYRQGTVVELHVPENGFISLNVPLSPLRIGSLSTRTTHPFFMRRLQELLDALGIGVRLVNRYQYKTKGEMMAECADQGPLADLAGDTMSCGRAGRINRHCGRCLPCLVRRGAFLHWSRNGGLADRTPYKFPIIAAGFAGADFAAYDDVMQCREAILTVRQIGARGWIGPAISPSNVPNPELARDTAVRGLSEIEAFLNWARLV
jgi:hypothetical protein